MEEPDDLDELLGQPYYASIDQSASLLTISMMLVRWMNMEYKSRFWSKHFSWTCLTRKIMLTVLCPDVTEDIMEDINCFWACSFVQFGWDSIFFLVPNWSSSWWMVFLISMIDGGRSSSSRVGCWSSAVALTDEGLFSKLLKCSAHHSFNISWSLISVEPLANSNSKAVKSCLEVFESALDHLPFYPTNGLSSHAVPSGLVL